MVLAEVNKETTKGYELIPLELQAIIADDNAAFADELHEWELRRAEREAAAQAEAQLRNKVELFKQEYHAHMDRLITRISEARSETEDHRLESFIHFLWEINSQDLAQTQIAETVYLQLFGERLDVRNRSCALGCRLAAADLRANSTRLNSWSLSLSRSPSWCDAIGWCSSLLPSSRT